MWPFITPLFCWIPHFLDLYNVWCSGMGILCTPSLGGLVEFLGFKYHLQLMILKFISPAWASSLNSRLLSLTACVIFLFEKCKIFLDWHHSKLWSSVPPTSPSDLLCCQSSPFSVSQATATGAIFVSPLSPTTHAQVAANSHSSVCKYPESNHFSQS